MEVSRDVEFIDEKLETIGDEAKGDTHMKVDLKPILEDAVSDMHNEYSDGSSVKAKRSLDNRLDNSTEKTSHKRPRRNVVPPQRYSPSFMSTYVPALSAMVQEAEIIRELTDIQEEQEQLLAYLTSSTEPWTLKEAQMGSEWRYWREAINDELKSIQDNNTWELVDLPHGRKPIGSKWVFKVKYHADGSIERYKARLVAQGFSQTEGLDYRETFAPVIRFSTIRLLLALAAHYDWEIEQMDVKTAFLYGDLDVEIYMKQPEGYTVTGQEHKVLRLKKTLYGLKQSPRAWNQKLDNHLCTEGFKRCVRDTALYIKRNGKDVILISVYVDDLLVISSKS